MDSDIFEFGGFRLNRSRRRLVDANGAAVPIPAKAFDALVVFLERPGTILERSALIEALWPNTIVEDNNLNQVVAVVRRAIGDGFITTIKGRGYQLVADVRRVPQERTTKHHRPSLVAATTAFVVLSVAFVAALRWPAPPQPAAYEALAGYPIPSYAESMTGNERAAAFFRSGLEHEIHGDSPSASAAAAELYERAVDEDPEFSLAWARLAIVRIDAFAFSWDRSETLRAMSLRAAETAIELEPALADAHKAMGWYHFHDGNEQAALRELAIAQRSRPEDPEVHWMAGMTLRDAGQWPEAVAELRKASELASEPMRARLRFWIAEAHMMLRQYDLAARNIERTLELSPGFAPALNARAMLAMYRDGDASGVKRAAEQPTFLNPASPWYWPPQYFALQAALYDRDYDTALPYLDAWQDDHWHTYQYVPKAAAYGVIHDLAGRHDLARGYFEQARRHLEAALAQQPERPAVQMALAEALAGLGEHEAADDVATRVLELAARAHSDDAFGPQFVRLDAVLRVFARTGAVDRAIEALDAYLSAPGFWSIEGLLGDPRLDSLREDPRFQALVQKHERDAVTERPPREPSRPGAAGAP